MARIYWELDMSEWQKMGLGTGVDDPSQSQDPGVIPGFGARSVQGWSETLERDPQAGFADIGEINRKYGGFPTGEIHPIVIYSDNNEDSEIGTGARQIEIFGLDADYNEASAIFNLEGMTPVETGLLWSRCNYSRILHVGSIGSAVGTITVQQNVEDGGRYVTILPLANNGSPCAFTVPSGMVAVIHNYQFSFLDVDENVFSVTFDLVARRYGYTAFISLDKLNGMRGNSFTEVPFSNIILPEKSDAKVRVSSVIGTVGASVRINYTLVDIHSIDVGSIRYSV